MTMNLLTGLHAGEAALLEPGFEEVRHPPHSPDLAPGAYHLFPNLKKHTHGLTFSTDDELKYATEEWLKEQSELFYFAGVEKLRDRYTLCVDKGGDQRLSIRGLPFKISKNSFLHISIKRKAVNVPFAHNTRIDIL